MSVVGPAGAGGASARQMHLAAFLYPTGYHVGAWRHRDVPADAGVNLAHYVELARAAEEACFDLLFLADGLGFKGSDLEVLSRTALRYVSQMEPLTLLSALATRTDRIGLMASASTTYSAPFTLARQFASLDHLSGGRAAWNLVTGQNPYEAPNFGAEPHPPHDQRYARAEEFADVVLKLWDSWAPDAFCRDKETGRFFRPDAMRRADHVGEHFAVRGPLTMPRTPQGHPVIAQAGSSDPGRALAGRVAEVVFTAQDHLPDAVAFRADVRARAAAAGRSPDALRVLVGVVPYTGPTPQDARAKHDELQRLIDPDVGLSLLATELGGVDLAHVDPSGPLPAIPESERGRSRRALLVETARREQLSVRDLYLRVASSRGHLAVVADGSGTADLLQEWFEAGACDGFVVMPAALPWGLTDFTAHVVPELRRRGLFRDGYAGTTLREHLGTVAP